MSQVFHLTLHGIGEPGGAVSDAEREYWLPVDEFHRVLDAIAGRADVALTFDDGNRSDAQEALPVLLDRSLKGTFFVCAGRLGSAGYLGETELRTLIDAGMTIGSHGMDHVRWRGLSAAGLQREIVDAKRLLEEVLGAPVTQAACPYGEYDRRSLAMLADAGFERVLTSDGGPARRGAWLAPRTTLRCGAAIETIEALPATGRGPRQTARRLRSLLKQLR